LSIRFNVLSALPREGEPLDDGHHLVTGRGIGQPVLRLAKFRRELVRRPDGVDRRRAGPGRRRREQVVVLVQRTRAAEADSFAGLVAAIVDDAAYELGNVEARLRQRLRLADDVVMLTEVAGEKRPAISDHPGELTIDVSSDERFIRSLDRLGWLSLAPQAATQG
jgi:hypothetical protein